MFKPVNRYVQIMLPSPSESATEAGILLPDDFKPTEERHTVARVVCAADDVKFGELLINNASVIVDKSMVEEINFDNKSINVVLENYIVGIIS